MKPFVYLFVLTFLLIGCSNPEKEEVVSANAFSNYLSEDLDNNYKFFRNNVITVGNHHFIPIFVNGRPDEYPQKILSLLQLFEKLNPDLKVTGWSIEKQQTAYITSSQIYGIWIDTEPR